MDVQELAEQLADIPMLSSLDGSARKLLAFTCEVSRYDPGELICEQGDVSDAVFIVLDGEAEVLETSGTNDIGLAKIGRNGLIGELAVLRGTHRSASVRALQTMQVLRIPNERFIKLIVENPDVVLSVLKDISGRLAAVNERLART